MGQPSFIGNQRRSFLSCPVCLSCSCLFQLHAAGRHIMQGERTMQPCNLCLPGTSSSLRQPSAYMHGVFFRTWKKIGVMVRIANICVKMFHYTLDDMWFDFVYQEWYSALCFGCPGHPYCGSKNPVTVSRVGGCPRWVRSTCFHCGYVTLLSLFPCEVNGSHLISCLNGQ